MPKLAPRCLLLLVCVVACMPCVSGAEVDGNPYRERLAALQGQPESDDIDDEVFLRVSPAQEQRLINKRPRGVDDPHFPASVELRPQLVPVPSLAHGPLAAHLDAGFLTLQALTPRLLTSLPKADLKLLVEELSNIPVRVRWRDRAGHSHSGAKHVFNTIRTSHWDKTNAAAALALSLGAQQETALLTELIALAPDAVLFELHGDAGAVVDVQVASQALIAILQQMTAHNTSQIASSAANIVQVYIEYWSAKDPDLQMLALTRLIYQSYQVMHNSGLAFSRKQIGVLLGGMLAGTMMYALQIKSQDEQRLWIVNSISNLVWATTTFVGVIPVAGSIVAGVAGTVSIAAVVWGVVYNKIGTRDFTPRIREIEGHIELAALEFARPADNASVLAILETLAWMRGAIHVNGLAD